MKPSSLIIVILATGAFFSLLHGNVGLALLLGIVLIVAIVAKVVKPNR